MNDLKDLQQKILNAFTIAFATAEIEGIPFDRLVRAFNDFSRVTLELEERLQSDTSGQVTIRVIYDSEAPPSASETTDNPG